MPGPWQPDEDGCGNLLVTMHAALMRFDFPAALPCVPDVLGARLEVKLPRITKAELCMPLEGRRDVGFDGEFLAPRVQRAAWFQKVNAHMSRDDWSGWGFFHHGGPDPGSWLGAVRSAVLRVAATDVTDDGLDKLGLIVSESLYDWYLLFRDWVEVLTHIDLGHEHVVENVSGRSVVETAPWVSTARITGERGYVLVNPPLRVDLRTTPHAERQDLQRAAREANRSTRPPEPHLLLRDARSALHRKMFRRCILDAAIAVEVVASTLIDDVLTQAVGKPARDALVQQRDPISRKIPILRGLGVSLPADLQKDLFTIRNQVIHQGKQATRSEARKALDAATTVVRSHVTL